MTPPGPVINVPPSISPPLRKKFWKALAPRLIVSPVLSIMAFGR